MHDKTETLNKMVSPNFEVQEIIRTNEFDGWKILRKFAGENTVIGMDLIPVATIKKDFSGIHVINQDQDVISMLAGLIKDIEEQFGYKITLPE